MLIAAAFLLVSCSRETGKDVLAALSSAASSGRFLYGHQDDLVYGKNWHVAADSVLSDPLERSDIRAVCGEYPAMTGFDIAGIELRDAENIDGVPFELMRRAAVTHHERGGIVTFSWHPRNPLTGGDAWDVSSDGVVASVLPGGVNHGMFMDWLSLAADFFASLKDSRGRRIPFIFRPWHENFGGWFWWSGDLCSDEQYKDLYSMTYEYLAVARGLRNIVWAYSPNSGLTAAMVSGRYPGDSCVDIIGLDHYCYGKGEEAEEYYMDVLRSDLGMLGAFASDHGKLLALCETGYEAIPDPPWWTSALLKGLEGIPVCYVLTWRNAWDKPAHYYAPFPGSPDAEDFKVFCKDPRTVFLDN